MLFENETEYLAFQAQSERPMISNFRSITEIQSGYFEDFKITLPLMRWMEFKPVAGGAGQIKVPVKGKGKYSVSSLTALEITLVNTKVGY